MRFQVRVEIMVEHSVRSDHVVVVGEECEATDFDATMRYVGTSAAINGTLELCVSTLSGM